MCRFTAYHGPPISLDEMLYRPDHSKVSCVSDKDRDRIEACADGDSCHD